MVIDGHESKGVVWDHAVAKDIPDFVERMQFFDMAMYLPDDILTKVDRASMGVGLEVRVPLLDHRVVEFAWTLPPKLRRGSLTSKWPLRQVLRQYVPDALVDRPKKGFSAPIGTWLRGPLRPWAEALISEDRLRREGYFKPRAIRQAWGELQAGYGGWHEHIWGVLMFQAWSERYRAGDRARAVAASG